MFKLPRLWAHQILLWLPGTLCPLRCSTHDVRLSKLQRQPSQVRTLFRKKPKPNNQVANNNNPKHIHVQEIQPVKAFSTHPPAANYTYAQATANSNANNTVPPLQILI